MALSGSLLDVSVAELLQLCNLGQKTGTLTVSRPGQEAVLHLRCGEVVHAVYRQEAGPDVVYRLLGWQDGEFCLEREDTTMERTVDRRTDALLLEGMRRLDEWDNIETHLADRNVVLRTRVDNIGEKMEGLGDEAVIILQLVNARRDVSTIVRESGIEPRRALLLMTELMAAGTVEECDPDGPRGDESVIHVGARQAKHRIHVEGMYA
jgi:hypothetical protein